MNKTAKRTWVTIDLDALNSNFTNIKKCVRDDCKIMSVVKAGAYGHGAVRIAAELEKRTDWFAVSNTDEAMQLRQSGIRKPVLILGYSDPEKIVYLAENNITQTVYSEEYASRIAEQLQTAGKTMHVHIKIDTGMNRIGFPAYSEECIERSVKMIAEIHEKYPCLIFEGIFSHFAVADEPDNDFTQMQFNRFMSVVSRLENNGIKFSLRHICNSAATINNPEMHLDMVRPGLILYGINPDEVKKDIGLVPVMELKSVISHVHTLKKGETVSYGRTFTADKDMKIATVPVGYADGLLRTLSGKTHFYIKGKADCLAPQIGRICMDQCMLDVTGLDVEPDDEVTVFGKNPGADVLAAAAGTIPYEFMCDVSQRVPRVYVRNGAAVDVMTCFDDDERIFAFDDELTECRNNIDAIDEKLAALFTSRMSEAGRIVQIKKARGMDIFVPEREAEVIERNKSHVSEALKEPYGELIKTILNVSKDYQEKIISD